MQSSQTSIKALTVDVFGTVTDWYATIVREGDTAQDGDFDIIAEDFHDLAAQLGS